MLVTALSLVLGLGAGTGVGPEAAADQANEPHAVPPAIGLRVVGEADAHDAEFLVGGLLIRLLQRGYCVTPETGNLSLRVELQPSSRELELDGECCVAQRIRVEGRGELADLELFHRLGAELPAPENIVGKSTCGADAIHVSLARGVDVDPELHRHWLSSIWRAGRGLQLGGDQQLCLQKSDAELRLGSGPECQTELQWLVTEERGLAERLNVIVGATLALAKQVGEDSGASDRVEKTEAQKQPTKPPAKKVGRFDKICKIRDCLSRTPRPPFLLPYGSVGLGGLVRRRGLAGTFHAQVGVMFRVPITVAFDVRMIAASAGEEAAAIDTDFSVALGYALGLSPRTGLTFGVSVGGRRHEFRGEGEPWSRGPDTWVFGGSVVNYWRVAKYMQLEIGLTPLVALDGWSHQIGVRSVRELGPSFAGMLTLGLAFKGNAHGDR